MFNFSARKELITKKKLEPIALKYRIEYDDKFHQLMNDYANVSVENKALFEDRPKMKATRKTLDKVKAQAKKLADTIDDLNETEQIWLWKGQQEVRNFKHPNPPLRENQNYETEVMGSPIFLKGIGNEGFMAKILEISDIRAALTVIQNFAQHGKDGLPKQAAGRQSQKGVYMLILNIQRYWTGTLERAFTFDGHEGEGITEAYQFCHDIAQAYDPKITPSQINSQMRKIIKEEHEKKRNPPNTVTLNIDMSDPH